MQSFPAYASVILDVAVDKALDYGISKEHLPLIQPGIRVEVEVRGHLKPGYVVEIKQTPSFTPTKPILNILSDIPLITPDLFHLALWISNYYCSPLRNVFKIILPPAVRKGMMAKEQLFVMRGKTRRELRKICEELREKKPSQSVILESMLMVKKGVLLSQLLEETKCSRHCVDALAKKGALILDRIKIDRSPLINEEYFLTKPKKLNPEQASSLKNIEKSLENQHFQTHLLHGITGSGKTEVYLQAIEIALKNNKGTIMLVPEISLTMQTIERFRSRFQENIAILHHRLSPGERNDEWHRIRSGEAKIVIGARSAIFSPVINLGLIIVDEEHEQSYKQSEQSPSYHARDVAVMRAKLTNSTIILGSATPSLESYHNATKGKYLLSELKQRAEINPLPKVQIIDMQKENEKAKRIATFSDALLTGIEQRYQKGEQTILFLNRRGYHSVLLCLDCQHTFKCPHCDVSLTFHLSEGCLSCHLCNYQIKPAPTRCPLCKGEKTLKFRGVGTEQIERSLHAIFPLIRTIRLDADTTKHKGSFQRLLKEFGTGKADLMIGTQMIAKGLHFPEVTLVGILNSDLGLNIPDFRASETTFQIITQVSGRAGRGVIPGEVIIQTAIPEHSTIIHAANQDYISFYQEEIAVRELFEYPPFCQLAKLLFSGKNKQQTENTALSIRQALIQQLPSQFKFHPVIPSGHAKIKDEHRFQFLLRAPSLQPLNQVLKKVLSDKVIPNSIRLFIDINPSSTFF